MRLDVTSLATTLLVFGALYATPAEAAITFDDIGLTSTVVAGPTPTDVGGGFFLQTTTPLSPSMASYILSTSPSDPDNGYSSGQDNGYRYLSAYSLGSDLTTSLVRSDSETFSLSGFDYHGWNNNLASSVTVTGYLLGGGTVHQTFAISNTFSDPFQVATLGPAFSDLTRVDFHGDLRGREAVYQIDNINASVADPPALPEPSTWAMMLLGFGAIGLATRRQRKTPSFQQLA